MTFKKFFHYVSYLQYPLMLGGIYFAFQPYIHGFELDILLNSINKLLVMMGLGISFSTLQDTSKTQNNFSKKVWESPRKGKFVLGIMSITTAFMLCLGTFGFFFTKNEALKEISFGIIVLGIGTMGMLKSASEMAEYHKKA